MGRVTEPPSTVSSAAHSTTETSARAVGPAAEAGPALVGFPRAGAATP